MIEGGGVSWTCVMQIWGGVAGGKTYYQHQPVHNVRLNALENTANAKPCKTTWRLKSWRPDLRDS